VEAESIVLSSVLSCFEVNWLLDHLSMVCHGSRGHYYQEWKGEFTILKEKKSMKYHLSDEGFLLSVVTRSK